MGEEVMARWSRLRSVLAAVTAAALLGSCGGGDGDGGGPTNPGNPGNPQQNLVRTVLLSNVGFVLNPDMVLFRNVDNPPVGTLDISADWSGGGNIDVYVTTECGSFSDVRSGRCQVAGKSDGTSKPEVVRFTTTANRTYTIWVHNSGPSKEQGAFEVGITTNGPIAPAPVSNDPRASLAPGPVARVVAYVYQIRQSSGVYRPAFQDSRGRWILHPGEFVVFDSTQLNANGDKCQWVRDPQYFVTDPQRVLQLRGSSQPFLLRTDVLGRGELRLQSTIDGVDSNVLVAVSE